MGSLDVVLLNWWWLGGGGGGGGGGGRGGRAHQGSNVSSDVVVNKKRWGRWTASGKLVCWGIIVSLRQLSFMSLLAHCGDGETLMVVICYYYFIKLRSKKNGKVLLCFSLRWWNGDRCFCCDLLRSPLFYSGVCTHFKWSLTCFFSLIVINILCELKCGSILGHRV